MRYIHSAFIVPENGMKKVIVELFMENFVISLFILKRNFCNLLVNILEAILIGNEAKDEKTFERNVDAFYITQ